MRNAVAAAMRECRRYFVENRYRGAVAISGNSLSIGIDTPWCCIKGSRWHDGVWQVNADNTVDFSPDLPDEDFTGVVWGLKPSHDFLAMCEEIKNYKGQNPATGLTSERFGNYERTWGGNAKDRAWESVFGSALMHYRRMYSDLEDE